MSINIESGERKGMLMNYDYRKSTIDKVEVLTEVLNPTYGVTIK